MNSARAMWVRSGISVFGVAVALVLAALVAGLYLADARIRAGTQGEMRLDAQESAALIASILEVESQALAASGARSVAPHDSGTPTGAAPALIPVLLRERAALDTVWLWDASGALVAFGVRSGLRNGGLPSAMAGDQLAPAVGGDTRLEVTRAAGRPPGLRLTAPIGFDGKRSGVVRGSYRVNRLLAPVLSVRGAGDAAIVLRRGADTLLVNGESPGQAQRLVVAVPVLNGDRWELEVAHPSTSNTLRIALWALGLLAIGVLAVGGVREHRDRLRVATRSAELERLSAELLRANRMKSEFLANVSHELRTPLNAIVGFVDLLRDGVYGELSPRQSAPVDRIAASAAHLRQLVDQVLDIAKMAAGRLEVHPEPLTLRTFIVNLASDLEPLVNEKSLTLSIAVGSVPRVRTDPTHLRQILVNLIGNAVKYTPSGSITIRARLVGDRKSLVAVGREDADDALLLALAPGQVGLWVAVQVADSGIGIAPQDQERIFDEFEQVDAGPRTHSAERGTGLGLAISRRLARLLGGELTVQSEVGRGSTFTLWLPVRGADLQRSGAHPVQPPGARAVSGGRSI